MFNASSIRLPVSCFSTPWKLLTSNLFSLHIAFKHFTLVMSMIWLKVKYQPEPSYFGWFSLDCWEVFFLLFVFRLLVGWMIVWVFFFHSLPFSYFVFSFGLFSCSIYISVCMHAFIYVCIWSWFTCINWIINLLAFLWLAGFFCTE